MTGFGKWGDDDQGAWTAIRASGKTAFLFRSGVLRWGLPMFLVMAGGPVLFGLPYEASSSPSYWAWQALLWVTAGVMYGQITWHANERNYLAFKQQARLRRDI